jgi:hypothetical protein
VHFHLWTQSEGAADQQALLMPCRAPTSNRRDWALIGVGAPPRQAAKSTTL